MTLKAKVEAVVYAAEEPVTLAQLAAIFSNEVLEELEAEAQARQSARGELAEPPLESAEPAEEPAPEQAPWEAAAPVEEQLAADAVEPNSEEAAPSEGALLAPLAEAEDKKAARQRASRVRDRLQLILDELIAGYAEGERGMEIREIAGGYRMTTKPEYHDAVRSFVKGLKPPMKLSLQALETLAVVAYKQPVTAPEVSEIRGVDSGGVLGNLIGRKLITTAGRKHVIGRPILYKTTKEFLLRFGLKDVNELPSMEEFEKMAGELAQAEAEAEDAAMRSSDEPPTFSDVPRGSPDMPQFSPEPVIPRAGSDTGEGDGTDEPGEENVTSLDIGPSPSPAVMDRNTPAEQDEEDREAESEIRSHEKNEIKNAAENEVEDEVENEAENEAENEKQP